MKDIDIVAVLASTAAEKRAYGWMYGGGGPMMNPYLGGMGYGGRWGGYGGGGYGGGGYGGAPNVGMYNHFGGYHGPHPAMIGPMQGQMMQGLQHGGQYSPLLQGYQPLHAQAFDKSWQDQFAPIADQLRNDARTGIGHAATKEVGGYQSGLDAYNTQLSDIQAQRRTAMEQMNKARGAYEGSGMARAAGGDSNAPWTGRLGALFGGGQQAAGEWRAEQQKYRQLDESMRAQEKQIRDRMAGLQRQSDTAQRRVDQLEQVAGQAGQVVGGQIGRGANIERNRGELTRDVRGRVEQGADVGMSNVRRPVGAPATPAGVGTAPPPPGPRVPTAPVPAAPASVQPLPRRVQPITEGPRGPRGTIKVATQLGLAELSARVHLEKQREKSASGFGDLLGGQSMPLPGSTTLTGRGKKILDTSNLRENILKGRTSQVMPNVAAKAQPKLDTASIMSSLGLTGMPSTLAHLPVESAVSMGVTAEQHTQLRKMLGLG